MKYSIREKRVQKHCDCLRISNTERHKRQRDQELWHAKRHPGLMANKTPEETQ
jgi:hypothetical protein